MPVQDIDTEAGRGAEDVYQLEFPGRLGEFSRIVLQPSHQLPSSRMHSEQDRAGC
jgi:hypothetical protein